MNIIKNNWPIKQFLILDVMAVGFGIIYFYVVNFLGTEVSVVSAVTTAIIYWILSVIVYGFSGKFKTDAKA